MRPHGLEHPAAPVLVDAIEAACKEPPQPPRESTGTDRLLRVLLTPLAWVLGFKYGPARLLELGWRVVRHRVLPGLGAWRRRAMGLPSVTAADLPDTGPKKVLFVMGYPGYLRYFDGTIELLRERGHDVRIAFDRPDYQPEGLKALDHMGAGVTVLDPPPRRKDIYGPFARGLRAAVDYARYLDPRFEHAHYLRTRRKKALELTQHFGFLARWPMQPRWRARLLVRALLGLEAAIPSSDQVEGFLRDVDPDVVLVSPLISQASPQTDVVKSARALGIPTMLCVASWDHLTTKGVIRVIPERIAVWNDVQRGEAVELHRVAPERIVVTGAQPFDRWFGRAPTRKRKEFCKRVGFKDEQPFLLFVGSTAGISRPDAEEAFVRSWIQKHPDYADLTRR